MFVLSFPSSSLLDWRLAVCIVRAACVQNSGPHFREPEVPQLAIVPRDRLDAVEVVAADLGEPCHALQFRQGVRQPRTVRIDLPSTFVTICAGCGLLVLRSTYKLSELLPAMA